MKKRIFAIFLLVVIVCSTVFLSSAEVPDNVRIYRDSYDEDYSIRVRASLQGVAYREGYYFSKFYATLMFTEHPDATMPPEYVSLNMTINVQITGQIFDSFTTADTILINHETLSLREFLDEEDNIVRIDAQYIARDSGGNRQFNPADITMYPSSTSELPES